MSEWNTRMPLNRGQSIAPVRTVVRNYNQMALVIDASGSTMAKMKKMINGKNTTKKVWDLIKEHTMAVLASLMAAEQNVIAAHLYLSIVIFQDHDVIELVPSTLLTELDTDAVQARLDAIVPMGQTPMGKAITTTLRRLAAERRELNITHPMGYPCLVVISDGVPTDDMTQAYRMVDEQLNLPRPHLTVRAIHIAVNPRENEAALKRLLQHAPDQDVVLLHTGDDFNKYVKLIEQTALAVTGSSSNGAQAAFTGGFHAHEDTGRAAPQTAGNTGGFGSGDDGSAAAAAPQPVRRQRTPVKPVPFNF